MSASTDIVKRLRGEEGELCDRLCDEAADEIERLRKKTEQWRGENSQLYLRIGEQMSEIERLRKDVQNLNRDCMMLAGNKP